MSCSGSAHPPQGPARRGRADRPTAAAGVARPPRSADDEAASASPPPLPEAIAAAIPHRPPFLFLDEVLAVEPQRVVCRKRFRGDEDFFAGHYPGRPIVPGVILCEAALQAGALLMSRLAEPGDGLPVVTRISDVRFRQMVGPATTIEIDVALEERLAQACYFSARISVAGATAARLRFACTLAPALE